MDQPLLKFFKKYLEISRQVSVSSKINYLSDVNRFLNWLTDYSTPNPPNPLNQLNPPNPPNPLNQLNQLNQQETIQAQQITPTNIKLYQGQLQSMVNPATFNRHQSSLRCFGQFLKTSGRLNDDPTQKVNTLALAPTWSEIIKLYQQFLKHEHLSNSTVKNYLSDLNTYLLWAQKNIKTTDDNQNIHS